MSKNPPDLDWKPKVGETVWAVYSAFLAFECKVLHITPTLVVVGTENSIMVMSRVDIVPTKHAALLRFTEHAANLWPTDELRENLGWLLLDHAMNEPPECDSREDDPNGKDHATEESSKR